MMRPALLVVTLFLYGTVCGELCTGCQAEPCVGISSTVDSTTSSCIALGSGCGNLFWNQRTSFVLIDQTGNTESCAHRIYEAIGSNLAAMPVDVDSLLTSGPEKSLQHEFAQHNALIVGTPTWNTGADTQRSGTGWDELYYSEKLPVLVGKKVAVFGLGDQVFYGENYADATGELYDVFTNLKCDMVEYAHVSQEGYEHEASKSIRGDKFCGLLLDEINQEELTDGRIEKWVEQLRSGGFFDTTTTAAAAAAADSAIPDVLISAVSKNVIIKDVVEQLEKSSADLDEETIVSASNNNGFTPHFNPVSGKTMWTSPDGRKSYVTMGAPAAAAMVSPISPCP